MFSFRKKAKPALLLLPVAAVALFFFSGRKPSGREQEPPPEAGCAITGAKLLSRTVLPERSNIRPATQTATRRGTFPYLILLNAPVTKSTREQVALAGCRILSYIPDNSLLVEATPSAAGKAANLDIVHAIAEFEAADKISPRLMRLAQGGGTLEVSILALSDCDLDAISCTIAKLGGEVLGSIRSPLTVKARVDAGAIAEISRLGEARWIEKHGRIATFNDRAIGSPSLNVAPAQGAARLTGLGQKIATIDSGIDTGNEGTLHTDFSGNIFAITNFGGLTTKDYTGHGTHTAASIAGNGSRSGGRFKGVAYEAKLLVMAAGSATPNDRSIYFPDGVTYSGIFTPGIMTGNGIFIQSDSWGSDSFGEYDTMASGMDGAIWSRPEVLVVTAMGNAGPAKSTISSPASGKNCLSVGNAYIPADNPQNCRIASTSSRGPCLDGRTKPDVAAPGTKVVSARSSLSSRVPYSEGSVTNRYYTAMSGTSMATALAAGGAALLRERMETAGILSREPSAALMKALLAQGAYSRGQPPDSDSGYGYLDVSASASLDGVFIRDYIPFEAGKDFSFSFRTTGEAPFSAHMAYIDYPGDPSAAKALVNNLDIFLTDGASKYHPNGLEEPDDLNTMEGIRFASLPAGEYTLHLICPNVPFPHGEGGAAALCMRGAFGEGGIAEGVSDLGIFTLEISDDSPVPVATSPKRGIHRILAGTKIRASAPPYGYRTNSSGTKTERFKAAGWSGSGAAASGGAGNEATIVLDGDGSLLWHYGQAPSDYNMGIFLYMCDIQGSKLISDSWIKAGETFSVLVPESAPYGLKHDFAGTMALTGPDGNEIKCTPGTIRFAALGLGPADSPFEYAFDENSRCASTNLPITMDSACDLYFGYAMEKSLLEDSVLPYWWYLRYLAGSEELIPDDIDSHDTDGDGMTNRDEYAADTNPVDPASKLALLGISGGRVFWQGGVERTQVLEFSPDLSPGAFIGIYTNHPPTGRESSFAPQSLPAEKGFFRIRALAK